MKTWKRILLILLSVLLLVCCCVGFQKPKKVHAVVVVDDIAVIVASLCALGLTYYEAWNIIENEGAFNAFVDAYMVGGEVKTAEKMAEWLTKDWIPEGSTEEQEEEIKQAWLDSLGEAENISGGKGIEVWTGEEDKTEWVFEDRELISDDYAEHLGLGTNYPTKKELYEAQLKDCKEWFENHPEALQDGETAEDATRRWWDSVYENANNGEKLEIEKAGIKVEDVLKNEYSGNGDYSNSTDNNNDDVPDFETDTTLKNTGKSGVNWWQALGAVGASGKENLAVKLNMWQVGAMGALLDFMSQKENKDLIDSDLAYAIWDSELNKENDIDNKYKYYDHYTYDEQGKIVLYMYQSWDYFYSTSSISPDHVEIINNGVYTFPAGSNPCVVLRQSNNAPHDTYSIYTYYYENNTVKSTSGRGNKFENGIDKNSWVYFQTHRPNLDTLDYEKHTGAGNYVFSCNLPIFYEYGYEDAEGNWHFDNSEDRAWIQYVRTGQANKNDIINIENNNSELPDLSNFKRIDIGFKSGLPGITPSASTTRLASSFQSSDKEVTDLDSNSSDLVSVKDIPNIIQSTKNSTELRDRTNEENANNENYVPDYAPRIKSEAEPYTVTKPRSAPVTETQNSSGETEPSFDDEKYLYIPEEIEFESNSEENKRLFRLVFPFCIPFDIIDLVQLLNAEPEAPYFELPIQFDVLGSEVAYTFVLDFAEFETLAKVIRVFAMLFYLYGLMVLTSKVIKW